MIMYMAWPTAIQLMLQNKNEKNCIHQISTILSEKNNKSINAHVMGVERGLYLLCMCVCFYFMF